MMRAPEAVDARCSCAVAALMLLACLSACDDSGPTNVIGPLGSTDVVLSNPGPSGSAFTGSAAGVAPASALSNVVYVSLVPGTVEGGEIAEITNPRTGSSAWAAMAEGGFDPVWVTGVVGDDIRLRIEYSDGSTMETMSYVPRMRSPIVVRTSPPAGKRDVVLNSIVRIVFSEPIDPGTVTGSNIRLEGGGEVVRGQLTLSGDGLRAELHPDAPLAAGTEYTLTISTGVRDLDGEFVEAATIVPFSTGTTAAVAEIFTDPAAVYVVSNYAPLNGNLRAAEFDAVLLDDGSVSGRFRIYYPEWGTNTSGSILCFSTAGDSAWASAVIEESHHEPWVGTSTGWYMVDGGSAGVGDRLALAIIGLERAGFGTPQDHCDTRPTMGPGGVDRAIQAVESGGLVVRGATPPSLAAPPPANLMFMNQPRNAIAGRSLGPLEVRALDETRTRTADFSGSVTLALASNAGGASLTGTTTVTAQNGIALFDDVTVTAGGDAYTLLATTAGLTSDTSDPFDVLQPSGGTIAFHDPTAIRVVGADGAGLTTLVSDPADGEFSHTQPAWSPDGDRLAFRTSRDGNFDIYVMSVDGSAVSRLTRNAAQDDSPEWSPDGARIVFTSDRAGGWDLWEVGVDGSGLRRLTDDVGQDISPAWSPDGSRIAFASDRHDPGSDFEIYVMNADGTGITRLTYDPDDNDLPDWSPDGSRIAYHGAGVYVMNGDGSGVVKVWDDGGAPTWSPDGGSIAFSAGDLYVVRTDGTGIVNLGIEGYEPDWSPAVGAAPVAWPSARAVILR